MAPKSSQGDSSGPKGVPKGIPDEFARNMVSRFRANLLGKRSQDSSGPKGVPKGIQVAPRCSQGDSSPHPSLRFPKYIFSSLDKFINNLPFYGYSILCTDNTNLRKLSNKIKTRKLITYSKNHINSDIKIFNIIKHKEFTEFEIFIKKGIIKGFEGKYSFKSKLLGEHNVLNATAAILASLLAEVPISNIKESLMYFQGVKRRFTFLGKVNHASIYDDYAHHPSEIEASYQIAKQISSNKIIVIFQPHRYSRTVLLFDDFQRTLFVLS